VLFSGIAVAIALAGMLIMPDILFKSFGIGTMVVVVTAVAASLTLLPAILGLMGDRVNWLTIPIIGRRSGKDSSGGFWNATTRLVTARPGISMLPHYTDERHAFYTFITEFSDGIITADIVVLAPDVSVAPVQNPMTDLVALIAADYFFGTTEAIGGLNGDMVDIRFAIAENISSQASFDAIKRIRNDYVPAAHCSDSKRYR
jgi:RND superfamily putative drug exporter